MHRLATLVIAILLLGATLAFNVPKAQAAAWCGYGVTYVFKPRYQGNGVWRGEIGCGAVNVSHKNLGYLANVQRIDLCTYLMGVCLRVWCTSYDLMCQTYVPGDQRLRVRVRADGMNYWSDSKMT